MTKNMNAAHSPCIKEKPRTFHHKVSLSSKQGMQWEQLRIIVVYFLASQLYEFLISHLSSKSFSIKPISYKKDSFLICQELIPSRSPAKNMYVFTNPKGTSWFMGLKFVFFFLPDHKDIVNISKPY